MGVPTLTFLGNRHAGRMVASVLNQVGLTEWIALTPEDFVTRARTFAQDVESLAHLRTQLRERVRVSPLCDGKRFVGELERAFSEVFRHALASS